MFRVPTPPAAASGAAGETLTVLIVDDDPAVREALGLLALSYGWAAQAFACGDAFLRARETWPGDAACVVLDINMPRRDGEAVLAALRERGSALPVVVVTAEQQGPRHERMLRAGASCILAKPFSDEAFEAAIRSSLAGQRADR